jgi:hypothetical protein
MRVKFQVGVIPITPDLHTGQALILSRKGRGEKERREKGRVSVTIRDEGEVPGGGDTPHPRFAYGAGFNPLPQGKRGERETGEGLSFNRRG